MRKDEVVLVDTSSWIEALRFSGRMDVRERVLVLMTDGRAAWCDMVVVELWNGAKGDYEKQKLSELEKEITCLETTPQVWQRARFLARQCRDAGHTVPSADLVIAACALVHDAGMEYCDNHMDVILKVHAASKRKR
jgi:predicted nucleic acid-binding protein